ncbi:hypothetical protein ASE86_14470 [Sphingomonas sp. Leaf33]|uniref:flagellar hook-basal body complex protein FliE n=1 Tax=Sphingomonas sp. Leaf33 TaxID=1736215 RepID=UPI0006F94C0B|nr:flagellar hook-basal body complex protein FliE [Sphingomonas sp. Leaf33]KQN21427.1 hypothetical protein ASE86_14470 [Sphingomonas sp. Leaf33]
MTIEAIPPLANVGAAPLAMQIGPVTSPPAVEQAAGGFGAMLMNGLGAVNAKLENADALVRRFAVDENVPVHHVTMALEEARLSLELAMQVRGRLVEGYRELMNMQL